MVQRYHEWYHECVRILAQAADDQRARRVQVHEWPVFRDYGLPPLGGCALRDRLADGGPGVEKASLQEERARVRRNLRLRASRTFIELMGTGMDMDVHYTYDSWMVECARLMQDLGYLHAWAIDRCHEAWDEYRWWRRIMHEIVWRHRRGSPTAYGDARRARRLNRGTPYSYLGNRTGGMLTITGPDKPSPELRGTDHLQALESGVDFENGSHEVRSLVQDFTLPRLENGHKVPVVLKHPPARMPPHLGAKALSTEAGDPSE